VNIREYIFLKIYRERLMLIMRGTHGTTVARVVKVKTEGFKPDKGRRGTGIYFWAESSYSRDLAIGWWSYRISINGYQGDNDTRCAIIYGKMEINDNEFLNLEDYDIKQAIATIVYQKNKELKKYEIAAIYDAFIKKVEEKSKIFFKILMACVDAPAPRFMRQSYPTDALGNPQCLIVRDPKCIDIEKDETVSK